MKISDWNALNELHFGLELFNRTLVPRCKQCNHVTSDKLIITQNESCDFRTETLADISVLENMDHYLLI